MACYSCLREWRASVGGVGCMHLLLLLLLLKYYITLNLPKYYVQRLEYASVWLKENVPKYARVLNMPEQE